MKLILLAAVALMLSGCLVTRDEIREDQQQPPSQQQVQQADEANRLDEIDGEIRTLRGRVGDLENNLNTSDADRTNKSAALAERVKALEDRSKIYEDELSKLDSEYLQIAQKVEALRASYDALQQARAKKKLSKKNSYKIASGSFNKKNWKEAIVDYQKYRELNPHGDHYAEATYKIGVAFNKLGMKPEARTFYTEAAQKFAKSKWGKKAVKKLKSLK